MIYVPTLYQLHDMLGDQIPAIEELCHYLSYCIKEGSLEPEEAERMTAPEVERMMDRADWLADAAMRTEEEEENA